MSENFTILPSNHSDSDLALAAQRGQKGAFVEIVARHQAMVCAITFASLRDFAASEDAAQETFLLAWKKINTLEDRAKLRGWLAQIAKNVALTQLRKLARSVTQVSTTDLSVKIDELVDPAPLPDEVAASKEELALVCSALEALPDTFREPLVLFYREGHSVKAVAAALEISEDAARQRLSRGRDMLRGRVHDLVERVLTHHQPTALFTIAVAVAIGALTAPSVIAGTVFASSAVSAATAASSTSLATQITTTMTTVKSTAGLAAGLALLCLPLGYATRASLEPNTAPQAVPISVTATPHDSRPARLQSLLDGPQGSLFAEWKKLHEVHGSTAADMPGLYAAIAAIKDPLKRRAFRAAQLAEWVELDATAGFAFLHQENKDYDQRQHFFSEWLAKNPNAAVQALLREPKDWDQLARNHLSEIAKVAPSLIPSIVAKFSQERGVFDFHIANAFTTLAEQGLDAARELALTQTGTHRVQAVLGVASAWAKKDAAAALAWAKSLPEGDEQLEAIRGVLIGQASVNPTAALDQMHTVPPGGREGYFATTTGARVLKAAAERDFDATVAWLAANPAKLGRQDMEGLSQVLPKYLGADPTGFLQKHLTQGSLGPLVHSVHSALMNDCKGNTIEVWQWLTKQGDDASVQSLRQVALTTTARENEDLALQMIADLPPPSGDPERDALLREAAVSLLFGNSVPRDIDAVLKKAPANYAQILLIQGFDRLNGSLLTNPQAWAQKIPLLPEEAKIMAQVTLARSWAEQDAFAASQYTAGLPTGPEKDAAITGLVQSIAEELPQEALVWAESMQGGFIQGSLQHAFHALNRQDPNAAKQWLENSKLKEEERNILRQSLTESGVK